MKFKIAAIVLTCLFSLTFTARAEDAKIVKVLPHYLDLNGKHAVSPSLFDRDAYQVFLMRHPEKCSGLRFDVQWRAFKPQGLLLKVEMRGSADNGAKIYTIEKPLKKETFWGNWTTLYYTGENFKQLGKLLAWRVTLWRGDQLISEQKSFLW
jgi:hypothetical protein